MARRTIDPEQALRDVGRRIAELRPEADLTQEQLATRAGIGWKYQQQIELGYENLTLKTLVKYADLFGVTLSELTIAPQSHATLPGRPPSKPSKAEPRKKKQRGV
jgi:transcriptional regulator with XRE-family HTH domain